VPEYLIGDQTVRRKNLYMPCIIGRRIQSMSDEEQVAIVKATRWADRITEAEWRALLDHDGCSPSARSRLKTKAAEWLVALARIYFLNRGLFAEITSKADQTYSEQIERESFLLRTVRNLAESSIECDDGEAVQSTIERVPIKEEN